VASFGKLHLYKQEEESPWASKIRYASASPHLERQLFTSRVEISSICPNPGLMFPRKKLLGQRISSRHFSTATNRRP